MALSTGIGGIERFRYIRPWNTKAMIVSFINTHVGIGRHMTVNALRAGTFDWVEMMFLGVIFFR